jgi:hypothetical protein
MGHLDTDHKIDTLFRHRVIKRTLDQTYKLNYKRKLKNKLNYKRKLKNKLNYKRKLKKKTSDRSLSNIQFRANWESKQKCRKSGPKILKIKETQTKITKIQAKIPEIQTNIKEIQRIFVWISVFFNLDFRDSSKITKISFCLDFLDIL